MGQPDKATILLVGENCPHCKALEAEYQAKIDAGEITVIPVESEDGRNLVDLMDIRAVPTILGLSENQDTKNLRICQLDRELKPTSHCIELDENTKKIKKG